MSGEYIYACVCCVAWKINETFKIIKWKVFVTLGSGELAKQNWVQLTKIVSAKRKKNMNCGVGVGQIVPMQILEGSYSWWNKRGENMPIITVSFVDYALVK